MKKRRGPRRRPVEPGFQTWECYFCGARGGGEIPPKHFAPGGGICNEARREAYRDLERRLWLLHNADLAELRRAAFGHLSSKTGPLRLPGVMASPRLVSKLNA